MYTTDTFEILLEKQRDTRHATGRGITCHACPFAWQLLGEDLHAR